MELAPAGITAKAILAGVTDTNALRQIPGYEKIMEVVRQRQNRLGQSDARTTMGYTHAGRISDDRSGLARLMI